MKRMQTAVQPLTKLQMLSLLTQGRQGGSRQQQQRQWTLEDLLTSEWGFGLTTATPVQRAICRAAQGGGFGDLSDDPTVLAAFGGRLPSRGRPDQMTVLAAIRGGKSKLVAAAAIWSTQVVDVSGIGPGETPRVSVVSVSMDQARPVFEYVKGYVESQPELKKLLVGEPTADTVTLRHPSGTPIEVVVSAGKRAGSSLVARWLASCIFDEAPRMMGQDDGVINLDDALSAINGRILPGGIVWKVGAPWAPQGPIYEEYRSEWGNPLSEKVIVKATGPLMNPTWWTPERCAATKRSDPLSYAVNVLAEFGDQTSSMYDGQSLDDVTRREPLVLPPEPLQRYVAAMDPATRGNAWTLVVVTEAEDGVAKVALAREWIGSKNEPLSPKDTLREISEALLPYGARAVYTDQWSSDALRDLAVDFGLTLIEEPASQRSNVLMHESLRARVLDRKVELPPLPRLRADLLRVRKRLTQAGATIELGADGTRHSDFAAALAKAVARPLPRPLRAPEPVRGTSEYDAGFEGRMRQQLDRQGKQQRDREKRPFWGG